MIATWREEVTMFTLNLPQATVTLVCVRHSQTCRPFDEWFTQMDGENNIECNRNVFSLRDHWLALRLHVCAQKPLAPCSRTPVSVEPWCEFRWVSSQINFEVWMWDGSAACLDVTLDNRLQQNYRFTCVLLRFFKICEKSVWLRTIHQKRICT